MATRKTVTKRPARKTVAQKSSAMPSGSIRSTIPLKNLVIPVIIVIIVILLGVFKNQFIVATVNGQPITRLQLISQLEKKDGKTVLSSMVTEQLILQEAAKRKVTVSDKDVSAQIATIEKSVSSQGENLDTLLAQQNMTRSDLNGQIKIQLLLKKMVGSNITVSDKDISDYMDQNKDSMPAGTDQAALKTQVKQQLEQQKLNDAIQKFVSNLQSKAKINYLLNL